MITIDNFKDLVQTLRPEEIETSFNADGDYILFEAHIFNSGVFATIESLDYTDGLDRQCEDHGNLFCDKDMTTKHLNSYLINKGIEFNVLPFGVQIDRKYYDYDTFKKFSLHWIGETFVIDYPTI